MQKSEEQGCQGKKAFDRRSRLNEREGEGESNKIEEEPSKWLGNSEKRH